MRVRCTRPQGIHRSGGSVGSCDLAASGPLATAALLQKDGRGIATKERHSRAMTKPGPGPGRVTRSRELTVP